MDDQDDAFGSDPPEDRTAADGPGTVGTYYGSCDEWFRRYWRHVYRRRVSPRGTGTGRWRADWWNVEEARHRLDALWRAWEIARRDLGGGMSTWWIHHAGPHMTALLAPDGCFAQDSSENRPGDPLPYTPPPAGLFPPDRLRDP